MKLQIDTELKTIKIEGTVNLNELMENLSKLLPNNEWKSYSLDSTLIILGWKDPIIINPIAYPTYPTYPFYHTTNTKFTNPYTIGQTNITETFSNSTYNLEIENESQS